MTEWNSQAAWVKQPAVCTYLVQAWQQKKLVHAYLFSGASGIGTIDVAQWFAQTLFCQTPTEHGRCGACSTCRRIQSNEFADIVWVEPMGATVKVEQIRQLKEQVSYSSLEHTKRVFILKDVEKMTVSAANSLLKSLEEPTADSYFLLLTENKDKVLSTVLSRTQVVTLLPLTRGALDEVTKEHVTKETLRHVLIALTQNVDDVIALGTSEVFQSFYTAIGQWCELLFAEDMQSFIFVQTTLLEWLSNREYALMGLDILSLYLRDALMVDKQQIDAVYLKKKLTWYEQCQLRCDEALAHVLVAKDRLTNAVSAQVCFESLVLDIVRG